MEALTGFLPRKARRRNKFAAKHGKWANASMDDEDKAIKAGSEYVSCSETEDKATKTSIHPLTALSKTLKIQEGLFELVRVF